VRDTPQQAHTVGARTIANRIYQADSRHLDMIEDGVVDLVICSRRAMLLARVP